MGTTVLNLGPSETLSISQDLCITAMSLVDPASAAGQSAVTVWAELLGGHDARCPLGTLSQEAPAVAVRPPVLVRDEVFLRHDAAAATVRFYGQAVLGRGEEEVAVVGDGVAGDEAAREEYEPLTEEDEAERYDSDNGEDVGDEGEPRKGGDGYAGGESSTKTSVPLVAAPPGSVVPDGEFLAPARFAAVENAAGFMRLAASEGCPASGDQETKEIVVLYRYTRFSKTWSGRRGVEECRRTKLHRLRFAVPPAGDMASSLAWVGASLGPLIYPGLFHRQLQELWTILAAPVISSIPPRATGLQVIVDVGILRREDYTPERMEHMRGELEAKVQEAWPEYYHVGMELHLPEPVRTEVGGGEDGARPAKRRKIADEETEECSVCFEPLESGLVAWPGCRHVFHGECLEKTLARSEMCPLCRNKLCRLVH